MGNFKELHVWQLAKDLAVRIYKLTQTSSFSKDFGLRDQIETLISIDTLKYCRRGQFRYRQTKCKTFFYCTRFNS